MAMSSEYSDLPWMPPRAYGTGRDGKAVRYIVIHYTAGAERSTSAEDGAAYDARRTDGTSTHYFADSDSVVQCVRTTDRGNAARARGNRLGIQYELCGTAQTRAQWLDAASLQTLKRAARQVARDCKKYDLPVRRLTVAETRRAWTEFPNGPKGIVGHVDCTNAYPEDGGDHTDPGAQFPWDVFLDLVRAEMQEEDMTFEADQVPVKYPKQNPDNPTFSGPSALGSARDLAHETRDLARTLATKVDLMQKAVLAAVQGVNEEAVLAAVNARADELRQEIEATRLGNPGQTAEEAAAALRQLLGDRAAEVGRLLATPAA